MGIKGWLAIGGTVLTAIAVCLGLKKKEDERYEKIQSMIRDVDRKEPEKKEEETKTIEEMHSEVTEAIMGMDIDGDDDETIHNVDKEADDVLKKGYEVLRKANNMLNDSEANRQKEQELVDNLKKISEDGEPQRFTKEEIERQKAQAEADYKRKVKKAVEQKNWSRLEDLFDQKYAGGPWHPSPASVFGQACDHGDISKDILQMAEEHFGKLWTYSGD